MQLICSNQNRIDDRKKSETTDTNNFALDEVCDFHSLTKLEVTNSLHFIFAGSNMELCKGKL